MTEIDKLPTRRSERPCKLACVHSPEPMFTELHHVIPQAWQRAVLRDKPPWSEGWAFDADGLFDARTDPLCPTSHGNVHRWIVRLTKCIQEMHPTLGAPIDGVHTAIAVNSMRGEYHIAYTGVRDSELREAAEALRRFTGRGGDIRFLLERGLWGSA